MERKTESLKIQRQRKMLLVLPLLVLPFITCLFWILGGGEVNASTLETAEKKGFNTKLPDANLKDGLFLDKMNYYEQATIDSAKFDELIKNDPNYLRQSFKGVTTEITADTTFRVSRESDGRSGLNTAMYRDLNEEKIHKKLEALQKVINSPTIITDQNLGLSKKAKSNASEMHSDDIDRLGQMMSTMNEQKENEDPELKQLSGMLENILDIQHPERVQERLRKVSKENRGQVFTISSKSMEEIASTLHSMSNNHHLSGDQSKRNEFYSLDENGSTVDVQNTVPAVIHETQTIVNGATVKLRLTSAIYINGVEIPKDNFLFGIASLKGERLTIKINSLRYNSSLYPVALSVYDMDGLDGIYIPGTINRDVSKTTADGSMQNIGMGSLDDSWGAKAAGAGIEAAKSLLSRKVKLVKVVLKAGYQVLLLDDNQKESDSN
jgi:conjugative transposon TraM protein